MAKKMQRNRLFAGKVQISCPIIHFGMLKVVEIEKVAANQLFNQSIQQLPVKIPSIKPKKSLNWPIWSTKIIQLSVATFPLSFISPHADILIAYFTSQLF